MSVFLIPLCTSYGLYPYPDLQQRWFSCQMILVRSGKMPVYKTNKILTCKVSEVYNVVYL